MTRASRLNGPRGFTVVEILIVIMILLVLTGILMPAVQQALVQAKVTATRTEIEGIKIALEKYHTDFTTYPPSCIWWKRVSGSGSWPGGWPDDWRWYTSYADDRDTMDGAECLVYFLGGGPRYSGFSVGGKRFGPYLPDLQGDVLLDIDNDRFREMQDGFRNGFVYLYFKADPSRPGNEYNSRDNRQMLDGGGTNPDGSLISPSPGEPVRDSNQNYYFPTTFQIISAGRDGRYARRSDQEPSEDDVTNFSSR